MNTCAICEHVSKPKLRKDVHSSGHQAAENNEESEVTQNIWVHGVHSYEKLLKSNTNFKNNFKIIYCTHSIPSSLEKIDS